MAPDQGQRPARGLCASPLDRLRQPLLDHLQRWLGGRYRVGEDGWQLRAAARGGVAGFSRRRDRAGASVQTPRSGDRSSSGRLRRSSFVLPISAAVGNWYRGISPACAWFQRQPSAPALSPSPQACPTTCETCCARNAMTCRRRTCPSSSAWAMLSLWPWPPSGASVMQLADELVCVTSAEYLGELSVDFDCDVSIRKVPGLNNNAAHHLQLRCFEFAPLAHCARRNLMRVTPFRCDRQSLSLTTQISRHSRGREGPLHPILPALQISHRERTWTCVQSPCAA